MENIYAERIAALRQMMASKGWDAVVVSGSDPHASEYTSPRWKQVEWLTGFTGEAGDVVITLDHAGLWTDSRYFIQAEEQLKDTGIRLFMERLPETPSIATWLAHVLKQGDTIGIDGWVNSHQEASSLQQVLVQNGLKLKVMTSDIFDSIWENRPSLPQGAIFILNSEYTGASCSEKLNQIQKAIAQNGASAIILSALDEIAWTLNLRGKDVHCNPVFISYLLISVEGYTLYIPIYNDPNTGIDETEDNPVWEVDENGEFVFGPLCANKFYEIQIPF